ncbi:glutaredoxin [Pilobolus umbonatus]|nr:glutaredoxin [Pilobolus umbonatus]
MAAVTQAIRDLVKRSIVDNKVMIFSKSYCPYCNGAKKLFSDINVPYQSMELDEDLDGEAIQSTLIELTNKRTVPNIFINQKHIGGYDDLKSVYDNGKLEKIFKEAGIKYSKL